MPRAFLSTSSLSVSLKKKMTRKANSKDALAPLGLLYDDCSHRLLLLLLLVFDMVINQKNSNSRRDGMRLKRNILVRSTFLLQLFATLRRERKQQQRRNKCCCCISTLAGAFEFLSLSPHSRPNELRGVLLTARNILLLSVPRQLFANVPNINGRKGINNKPKNLKKKRVDWLESSWLRCVLFHAGPGDSYQMME